MQFCMAKPTANLTGSYSQSHPLKFNLTLYASRPIGISKKDQISLMKTFEICASPQ